MRPTIQQKYMLPLSLPLAILLHMQGYPVGHFLPQDFSIRRQSRWRVEQKREWTNSSNVSLVYSINQKTLDALVHYLLLLNTPECDHFWLKSLHPLSHQHVANFFEPAFQS